MRLGRLLEAFCGNDDLCQLVGLDGVPLKGFANVADFLIGLFGNLCDHAEYGGGAFNDLLVMLAPAIPTPEMHQKLFSASCQTCNLVVLQAQFPRNRKLDVLDALSAQPEASWVFRRLLSVRRSYDEPSEEQVFA